MCVGPLKLESYSAMPKYVKIGFVVPLDLIVAIEG